MGLNMCCSDDETQEEDAECDDRIVETKGIAPRLEALLRIMSDWLETLISNEKDTQRVKETIFHGVCTPDICLMQYMQRIAKYAVLDCTEFILTMLYLRRLMQKHAQFPCSERSMHRVILAVVLIATKMHRETTFSNKYYARIGGISLYELARLERCVLELLEYRLFVSKDEFEIWAARWYGELDSTVS